MRKVFVLMLRLWLNPARGGEESKPALALQSKTFEWTQTSLDENVYTACWSVWLEAKSDSEASHRCEYVLFVLYQWQTGALSWPSLPLDFVVTGSSGAVLLMDGNGWADLKAQVDPRGREACFPDPWPCPNLTLWALRSNVNLCVSNARHLGLALQCSALFCSLPAQPAHMKPVKRCSFHSSGIEVKVTGEHYQDERESVLITWAEMSNN